MNRVRVANRVQALTIETTVLVSTSFLSNVNGWPETLAVYRSSTGRANVVLDGFSLRDTEKDPSIVAKPQAGLI
jgi:hypothetical protein